MGWGSGVNAAGRPVGYLVEATCDGPDCTTEIDRGLAYVCGGMHDGGELGCGDYFCADHLAAGIPPLCTRCAEAATNDADEGMDLS